MPMSFWIARLCEEFHCLPSQAWREMQDVPTDALIEILEARAYAQAKGQYDAAKNKQDVPQTPMVQLVKRIDFELATEAMQS